MFQPNANFCNQANCLSQPLPAVTQTGAHLPPVPFFPPVQFAPGPGSWVPGQNNFWTWVPLPPAQPHAPIRAPVSTDQVVTTPPPVVTVQPAAVTLPPALSIAPVSTTQVKSDDVSTEEKDTSRLVTHSLLCSVVENPGGGDVSSYGLGAEVL